MKKIRLLITLLSILPSVLVFQNCDQNAFRAKTTGNLGSSSESLPEETQPPITASGKIYYVSKTGNDTNGLSQTTAFRTIQKAADIAEAGDTVVVLAGIYKEFVQNKNDGKANARIRYITISDITAPALQNFFIALVLESVLAAMNQILIPKLSAI